MQANIFYLLKKKLRTIVKKERADMPPFPIEITRLLGCPCEQRQRILFYIFLQALYFVEKYEAYQCTMFLSFHKCRIFLFL